MKNKKSAVLVSRSELEAYCAAQDNVFGYDAMRDWLHVYAETAHLSTEAWQLYISIMRAY